MENATKFLLIAAAALIVILLIAFAISITNSASDVSGQATQVGSQISNQTTQAAGAASSVLMNLTIPGTKP